MRIHALLATASVMIASAPDARGQHVPRPLPFAVGERAEYKVDYLWANGSGVMEVMGVDAVRGRDAYHFRFVLAGKATGLYSLVDTLNSWTDTSTFQSLRFHQDQLERKTKRIHRYEIFPDRRVYSDRGRAEVPSVPNPLDDVSFLYFIRGQPLEVGKTHSYNYYFRPDGNPVALRVLRKETIETPLGRFPAIVVRPIIKSRSGKGLFSENAQTEVWFADDSTRRILQIKAKMPVLGTLTMKLRAYRPSLPALEARR
jgi:hypothetical protein